MGRRPVPKRQVRRSPALTPVPEGTVVLCGISRPFGLLSPTRRCVTYVLLTRAPLARRPKARRAFDLHVLSPPLAFVLSQDQTLQFVSGCSSKLLISLRNIHLGIAGRIIIQFSKTDLVGPHFCGAGTLSVTRSPVNRWFPGDSRPRSPGSAAAKPTRCRFRCQPPGEIFFSLAARSAVSGQRDAECI